jgi:hypothetical protein
MPTYQQTITARERAKRIREVSAEFRRERVTRNESQQDIRRAMQSPSASAFLFAEVQS